MYLNAPVLITGGTGMQGKPTVAATLARGVTVRALVRNPDSAAAREIAAMGAELATGSFEDQDSLKRAVEGVRSVFSLQNAHPFDAPLQHKALVAATRDGGVAQFVQSTVSGTGSHVGFPGWSHERWSSWYWTEKAEQEDRVRDAGFEFWTFVRPAMLMDNFLPYRAAQMHPELVPGGIIRTATQGDTVVAYVSAETVGAAGAAALVEPERFNGVVMELADDLVSLDEVAVILGEVTGKPVKIVFESIEDGVKRGIFEGIRSAEDWLNVVGYPARPAMLADYGLTPLRFKAWASNHAHELEVGPG